MKLPQDNGIIEQFADALWMERGLSQNTLASYQSDLRRFALWLETERGRNLLRARREDLLEYLAQQSMEKRKARSTARFLSCVRQFYQHALRESWLEVDPSARVEAPKLGRPLPKSLTETEVRSDDQVSSGPIGRCPTDPRGWLLVGGATSTSRHASPWYAPASKTHGNHLGRRRRPSPRLRWLGR